MEISRFDCRIFKWLQKCCVLQQAFRADFYMHLIDLIRSKLHTFSSSLCVFLNVCLICWSWTVKSSYVFCLRHQASDTHEKLFQTLLQSEVLALAVLLLRLTESFWRAQLSHRNKTDKAPCSSETFAHCVVPTPAKTSQCTCINTKKGMWVHHLPNCWLHVSKKLVSKAYSSEMVKLLQSCPLATRGK